MNGSEAKRLDELGMENASLKKLLTEVLDRALINFGTRVIPSAVGPMHYDEAGLVLAVS
ncbi:hypothetical protein [Luteimonas sp. A482]